MFKKIISIVILTFVFFLLLMIFFGSSGWFAKAMGLFFQVIGGVPSENLHAHASSSQFGNTFTSFFQSLDHAVYSPDNHCRVAFTVPHNVENARITFQKTSQGMLVLLTTKEGDQIGGTGLVNDQRIYADVEPCVIYGREVVQNLCENLKQKQHSPSGQIQWKTPEYYVTDVTFKDNKLFFRDLQGNMKSVSFETFYFYRVDPHHICFLPNDEHGIDFFGWFDKNQCLEDNILDPDSISSFERQFPVCREGSLPYAINRNGFLGMVDVLKTSSQFFIKQFAMSSFDFILTLPDFEGFAMPQLLLATIYAESTGNLHAISHTGVYGLTQIEAKTASNLKVCYNEWCDIVCDTWCHTIDHRADPLYAILGAYKVYEQKYYDLSSVIASLPKEEQLKMIIAAYNAGSGPILTAIHRLQAANIPLSWDAVAQELKPEDITYFKNYQEKVKKVQEVRKHVPKVLAALYEANNVVAQARRKQNSQGETV